MEEYLGMFFEKLIINGFSLKATIRLTLLSHLLNQFLSLELNDTRFQPFKNLLFSRFLDSNKLNKEQRSLLVTFINEIINNEDLKIQRNGVDMWLELARNVEKVEVEVFTQKDCIERVFKVMFEA